MNDCVEYGPVSSADELGAIVRAHRKSQGVTLERVSGLGNLSMRFLSEFERGKETAEIGKILHALHTLGLELIVQPRERRKKPISALKIDTRNLKDDQ